jgi:transcriptional regulator with XRE-family HTH domain
MFALFSRALKELREIIGISQVELAKKIGISQLTMSNYEMSKR